MDRGRVGGVIDGGTVPPFGGTSWSTGRTAPSNSPHQTATNSTADVNRCATAAVRRRELLGGLIP